MDKLLSAMSHQIKKHIKLLTSPPQVDFSVQITFAFLYSFAVRRRTCGFATSQCNLEKQSNMVPTLHTSAVQQKKNKGNSKKVL